MAKYNFSDLKTKYGDFQHPIMVLTIDGKDISKNDAGFVVSDIEVELTSGYEASIATFCIYNTFDNETSQFKTDEVKKYICISHFQHNFHLNMIYPLHNYLKEFISLILGNSGSE